MFPRPAAPIFCSVSKISDATLGTFLVGALSMAAESQRWQTSGLRFDPTNAPSAAGSSDDE